MAKVDTNVIALNYARQTLAQAIAGTKPAEGWRSLEPNEISQFGANIATTPREPISDRLQRRKGTPTDLDAPVAFTADLTYDGFWDWIEAAVFSRSVCHDVRDLAITGVDGTDDEYDLPALGESRAGKLNAGTLLWAERFKVAANNGLKHVATSAAAADTKIDVGAGLTDDTTGIVSMAGFRISAAAGRAWAYSADTHRGTLTSASIKALVEDKLTLGQIVHFGSIASEEGDLQNGLSAAEGAVGATGYGRLVAWTATTLVFDRLDTDLQANVAIHAAPVIDLVFGDFIRNVSRSNANYVQLYHAIEQVSPALFDTDAAGMKLAAPVAGYEYAQGQVMGTLVLNFPLTDKATMNASFVGLDVEKPTRTRAQTAAPADVVPVAPRRTEAFNTSADFVKLVIDDDDEDGIESDFKSLTITINPQTSAEKILGKLGAQYINRGNLLVDVATQVIFSSPVVPNAIRDNATLRFQVIVVNGDGVIAIDVPSQTIGGGGREYPQNQAVLINATGEAFEDATLGTSIGISTFPLPLPGE